MHIGLASWFSSTTLAGRRLPADDTYRLQLPRNVSRLAVRPGSRRIETAAKPGELSITPAMYSPG